MRWDAVIDLFDLLSKVRISSQNLGIFPSYHGVDQVFRDGQEKLELPNAQLSSAILFELTHSARNPQRRRLKHTAPSAAGELSVQNRACNLR